MVLSLAENPPIISKIPSFLIIAQTTITISVTEEPFQPPDLAGSNIESENNPSEDSPSHVIVSGRPKTRQSGGHKQVIIIHMF